MGIITDGPTAHITSGFGGPPAPPGRVPKRTFTRYKEQLRVPIMMGYVPDRETGLLYPVHGSRHGNDRAAQFEGGPRA